MLPHIPESVTRKIKLFTEGVYCTIYSRWPTSWWCLAQLYIEFYTSSNLFIIIDELFKELTSLGIVTCVVVSCWCGCWMAPPLLLKLPPTLPPAPGPGLLPPKFPPPKLPPAPPSPPPKPRGGPLKGALGPGPAKSLKGALGPGPGGPLRPIGPPRGGRGPRPGEGREMSINKRVITILTKTCDLIL